MLHVFPRLFLGYDREINVHTAFKNRSPFKLVPDRCLFKVGDDDLSNIFEPVGLVKILLLVRRENYQVKIGPFVCRMVSPSSGALVKQNVM